MDEKQYPMMVRGENGYELQYVSFPVRENKRFGSGFLQAAFATFLLLQGISLTGHSQVWFWAWSEAGTVLIWISLRLHYWEAPAADLWDKLMLRLVKTLLPVIILGTTLVAFA